MAKKISTLSLRKDMFMFDFLSSLSFTFRRHDKKIRLDMKTQENIRLLDEHQIHVRAKDVKVWARYIDRFAGYNRQALLQRLQSLVDYDVQEYLDKKSKGGIARYFKSSSVSYLTSSQLIRKYKKYIKLCKKMRADNFSGRVHAQASQIRRKAKQYAAAVVEGKISVKPEDYEELWNYFNVICYPEVEGDMPYLAKKKIKALQAQQDAAEQAGISAQVETKDDVVETTQKRSRFAKLKIWALSGVVALAGCCGIGMRYCSQQNKENNFSDAKTELLVENDSVAKKDTTVISFADAQQKVASQQAKPAVQKKVAPQRTKPATLQSAAKPAARAAAAAEATPADSVQRIWRNYYDNTIEILSSSKTKTDLYQKIERQIADSVFVLPQNISKERLAYAYIIYKEYGVNSTIGAALERTGRLSATEQARLFEDVMAAGAKGEGVKQMALARSGGQLSSYSRYDRASQSLQKRHVKNLHQLGKLKVINHSR